MLEKTSVGEGYPLNDGKKIPIIGLGVWAMDEDQTYNAVLTALKEGYRLIDTAAFYKNETAVGRALKECGLNRDEYYIVTKLHPETHGYNVTRTCLQQCLERLQLEYVDLFLIHSPRVGQNVESWRAMVELKEEGKIRSIGVSNFSAEHIQGLLKSGLEKPAVNQIEIHPTLRQGETVSYCKEQNITLMNYCPLARGQSWDEGKYPIFDSLQEKLKKTKAQLFLKWALQSGYVTIPKSANAGRIRENIDLFDWSLSDEDMTSIGQLEDNVQCSTSAGVMHESWDSLENKT